MAGETSEYGPVLTTAQVAKLLDLNPQTVQQMAKDGRLPAHRLPGARKYLCFLDDVLGFVRQHKVQTADGEHEPETSGHPPRRRAAPPLRLRVRVPRHRSPLPTPFSGLLAPL